MLKFLNRLFGRVFSDYYFYKWIHTNNEKYLNKYLDLI